MREPLLVASIATALVGSTAILIAATGELLVEKVGVYNIGLEGVMLCGALGGFVAADASHSWVIGLLAAGGTGAAAALVFGVATVLLRADMVLAGIALFLVALGLTGELGSEYVRKRAPSTIPEWDVPLLSDIPYLGPALFQQQILVYVAFVLPFLVLLLLNHTPHGLHIRAIGENPRTADEVGISVVGWRLAYVVIGGVFAGVAGGFLTLGSIRTWTYDVTAGQGWIAFAIVIFSGWRPLWLLVGAYLFGLLGTLGNIGQAEGWNIPEQVFTSLPYIGTVAIVVFRAWIAVSRGRPFGWPAALGRHFYRGG